MSNDEDATTEPENALRNEIMRNKNTPCCGSSHNKLKGLVGIELGGEYMQWAASHAKGVC
jgi:hypothetical protein